MNFSALTNFTLSLFYDRSSIPLLPITNSTQKHQTTTKLYDQAYHTIFGATHNLRCVSNTPLDPSKVVANAGHSSDKTGFIDFEFTGTDKERIETSEGIGAYLHLLSFFQKDISTPPISLMTEGCTTNSPCVVVDLGGDPTRSVADFVEANYPTLKCIPLNPIEAKEDYLSKKKEINFSDSTYNGTPIHAVTSISVLNVIKKRVERKAHIKEILSMIIEKGGYCFFKVWKSENRFNHKINRDIASYRSEIKSVCKSMGIPLNQISNIVDDTIVIKVPSRVDRKTDSKPFTVESYNGPLPIEGRPGNITAEFHLSRGYSNI